jgi:AraC family L-rhamnose operon regulatory protein RhaS
MEWRTHPFVKVVYVLSGRGTFFLGKKEQSFADGDVIVVPLGTRNRIVDDAASATSLYVCCVARSLLRFDASLDGQLPCRVLRREAHFAQRVASVFRRMVHTQQSSTRIRSVAMVADAMKLIQLICEKSGESIKSEKGSNDDRRQVQQYVDSLPSRFFEESSIDAAVHQLDIPRRTFTKLFAEIAGETWLQHVRRLAIEHAQRRLRGSDVPIASIASECGFNDLSTFYRQFQRRCGMSPGAYRTSTSL